ncbi:unnamed protein product [Parnassius mnemosyne]|uniref:VWFA domain-containing protein n=1 Tax=Parnassius mnemosyne TaxID=213953 RepID=A0AAV1L8E9_9NEOP
MKFHLVYRNNERNNPVLGNREPIIESIDQEISDQTSQPTEVYLGAPRFLETTNLTERETHKSSTSPCAIQFQPCSIKLYYEYLHGNISTLPNSYHNSFEDYTITNANSESRFKLPISEQYDPEGKIFDGRQTEERIIKKIMEMKIKRNLVENKKKSKNNESQLKIKTETISFNSESNKYESKDFSKVFINTDSIKSTANSIVNESIDKAITVAQEIFKEIDTESIEHCTPPSQLFFLQDNILSNKLLGEEADILPKSVKESVQLYERIGKDSRMDNLQKENKLEDERKLYLIQEIEESIEVGSVRRKSVIFENEAEKLFRPHQTEDYSNDETVYKDNCHLQNKTINIQAKTELEDKMKSTRILAQTKAFKVGSQMILHIIKITESSNVYSSLLKILYFYFLNLIIAFYRFILMQPSLKSNNYLKNHTYYAKNLNLGDRKRNETELNILDQHFDEKHLTSAYRDNDEALILRKKKLSGSEMAQMSLRKPEELTQIMDAVISEFHTKLNIGGSQYTVRLCNKMSENSSNIEEVEIKESDTLEWLTKMDSEEKERIRKEIKLATIEAARRVSESRKTFEQYAKSHHDSQKYKSDSTDSLTYIAIVESHVYTNTNLIFDKYFSSSNVETTQNSEFTSSNNVGSATSEYFKEKTYNLSSNTKDDFRGEENDLALAAEKSKSMDIKSSMVLPDTEEMKGYIIRTDYVATVNVEHKSLPIVSDEKEYESIMSEIHQSIDEGIEVQAVAKTATIQIASTSENSETKESHNSLIKQEAHERTLELHEEKSTGTIESRDMNKNVLQTKESLEMSELQASKIMCQSTATQINTQIETTSENKSEYINVKENVAVPVIEVKELNKVQALNRATARQISAIFEDIQNSRITNVTEEVPCFSLGTEELSIAQALCKETVIHVPTCSGTEQLDETTMSVYFEENDYFSINKSDEEVAIICFQAQELLRVNPVCTPVALQITIYFDEVESIKLDRFEIEKASISEEVREFFKTYCIVYATTQDIRTYTEENLSFKTDDTKYVLASINYEPQVLVTVSSVATPLITQLSINYIDAEFMKSERFQEENAKCSVETRESPSVLSMCYAAGNLLKFDAEESYDFEVDEVKKEFSSICIEPQVLLKAFPMGASLIRQTSTIFNEAQCIESEIIQEKKADSCIVKEIFMTARCTCTATVQTIITNLIEINSYEVEQTKEEQAFGGIEPNIFEIALSVGTATAMQINVIYVEAAFKEPDTFEEEVALSSLESKEFVRTYPMCQAVAAQMTTIFEETETMSLNYDVTEEFAKIVDVPYYLISTLSISLASANQIIFDSEMMKNFECSDVREEQIAISIQEHELKKAVAVLIALANNEYTDLYSVQDDSSINFYCDKQLALISEPTFLNFALSFNNATVQQASFTYEDYETQVIEYPVKYEHVKMTKETKSLTIAETMNKAVVINNDGINLFSVTNKDDILKQSAAAHLQSSSYSELSTDEILSNDVIKKTNVELNAAERAIVSENQRIIEKEKDDNKEAFSEKESNLNVSVIQKVETEASQKYQQLSCELSLSKNVRESASERVKGVILMAGTEDIKSNDFRTDLLQTTMHKLENGTGIVIQDITQIGDSFDESVEIQLNKDISTSELQEKLDKLEAQTTKIYDISEELQDVTSTKNLSALRKAKTATDESEALKIIKKEERELVYPVLERYEEEDLTCSKLINTAAFSDSVSKVVNQTKNSLSLTSGRNRNDHSFALKETGEQLLLANTLKSHALRSSSESESTVHGLKNIELNVSESLINQSSNGDNVYNKSLKKSSVSQATSESSILSYSNSQKLTKSAKSSKLVLKTDLNQEKFAETQNCVKNVVHFTDIQSPTTPPTPLTDEYIFRLVVPLPKSRGTTPVPRDPSPEIFECVHVKGSHKETINLISKVETEISEGVSYNPSLSNLPTSPPASSVYTKPGLNGGSKRLPRYIKLGLRGGSDRPPITKEDILEVQRKSSILTSAITETLKSIEEYKREFGILKKQGTEEQRLPNTRIESEGTMSNINKGEMETFVRDTNIHQNKSNADIRDLAIEKEEIERDNLIIETDKTIAVSVELFKSETEVKDSDKKHDNYAKKGEDIILEDGYSYMQIVEENQIETNMISKNETNNEIKTINSAADLAQSDFDMTDECNSSKEFVVAEGIIEYPTEVTSLKVVSNNEAHNKEDKEIIKENINENSVGFINVKIDTDHSMFDAKKMEQSEDEVYKTPDEKPMTIQEYILNEIQSDDIAADQEVADVTEKTIDTDRSISVETSPAIAPKENLLKEEHVISLTRVLSAHMLREELSPDCYKTKTSHESQQELANNEHIEKEQETIKEEKNEIKWTTFLQKSHPVPVQTLGHFTDLQNKFEIQNFNSSPLPWQERALADSLGARGRDLQIEEPILIPEEEPEYLIAVPSGFCSTSDPEDADLPLTSPLQHEIPRIEVIEHDNEAENYNQEEKIKVEEIIKDALKIVDRLEREAENNELVQTLLTNIKSIADSAAPIEEQLRQMKSQLETLAQVPNIIRETWDNISERLNQIGHQKKEETIPHSEYIEQHLDSPAQNQDKSEGVEVSTEERIEPQIKETEVTTKIVAETMPAETSATLTVTDDSEKKNTVEQWNKVWPWTPSVCRKYRESNCHLVDFHNVQENVVPSYNKMIKDKLPEVRETSRSTGPPPTLRSVQADPRHGASAAEAC